MKKFGLTLLSLILVCCFFVVGCSFGTATILVDNEHPTISYEKLQQVNYGEGVSTLSTVTDKGNIVVKKVVEEKTQYGVFSVLDNKQVVDFAELDTLTIVSSKYADYALSSKTENEVTTYKLVALDGTVMFEGSAIELEETEKFGKVVYEHWNVVDKDENTFSILHRIKGDKRKELAKINHDEILLNDFSFACLSYGPDAEKLLVTDAENLINGNSVLKYYNFEGELKREVELDTNNLSAVLGVGKYLLVQYKVEVDAMSDDFDVIESDVKYNYDTYRLNALTGKTKRIKTEYVFSAGSAGDVDDETGVAVLTSKVYRIENEKLRDVAMLVISDNCTDIEEVNYSYTNVTKLSKKRFVAETDAGKVHIVDAKYDIIADLSEYEIVGYADEFIAIKNTNDKVAMIDFNGKMIKSFKEYGAVNGVYNNLLVVLETVEDVENNKTTSNIITIDVEGTETVIGSRVTEAGDHTFYFQGTECTNLNFKDGAFIVDNENVYAVNGTQLGSLVDATEDQINHMSTITFGEFDEYNLCTVGSNTYLIY